MSNIDTVNVRRDEAVGTGRRVKLWVERGSSLTKPGPFTGEVVDRTAWTGTPRDGLHIRLDRGGFVCLAPTDDEPPAEWLAAVVDAIDRVADPIDEPSEKPTV